MRVPPPLLALIVGGWAAVAILLARNGSSSGCPLGACTACGACFPQPRLEHPFERLDETRVV